MDIEQQPQDTLQDQDEPKSAAVIHAQLELAADAMREWNDWCNLIDDRYSLGAQLQDYLGEGWTDQRYDLYWASMEVIKPAIYTRCPKPVVGPRFGDKTPLLITVSDMLERCLETSFDLGDMHGAMLEVRDDLAMANRGVLWVRRDEDRICYEQLDRQDFRHEPARKWADVGWVARRGWMTKTEVKKRFGKLTADDLDAIFVKIRRDDRTLHNSDESLVAGVWEVWHKAEKKVYFVADGFDRILEEDSPHHDLKGFFPCPKPAYGTLKRRTLIPVPDYFRYAPMMEQINDLTRRVYNLLAWVKMVGLVPGGGDVSEALQASLREHTEDTVVIPVPAAAMTDGQMVQWLPLGEISAAITGLLEARGVIIQDFYQLSGISDIMRGATDAGETLGAQQLKSQYGSVRVRDKINELQRIARDAAAIGGEIIAEEFSKDAIMEMSMIDLPTNAQVRKQIKDTERDASEELKALQEQPPQDEQQMEQFQQAQQQIIAKYGPMLEEAEKSVTIDQVMELLRKDKSRGFSIDIETDSTVMTDEITEKQQRAEFLGAFQQAAQAIMTLTAAGESGAALAGGVLKFALAPYRVGRDLQGQIDDFIEQAPAALAQQGQEAPDEGLAAAQMALAEAEKGKAQAAIAKVEADTMKTQLEIQLKQQEAEAKAAADGERIRLEFAKTQGDVQETQARTEKLMAEVQLIMSKIGIDAGKLELDAARTVADQEARQTDQQMSLRMHQDNQQQAAQEAQNASRPPQVD